MKRVFKKGQPVQWVSSSNSTSLLMDLGWVEEDIECEGDGHVRVFWLLENRVMLSSVKGIPE